MSAVKLRIEIERALRDFTAAHEIESKHPLSITARRPVASLTSRISA